MRILVVFAASLAVLLVLLALLGEIRDSACEREMAASIKATGRTDLTPEQFCSSARQLRRAGVN